MLLLINPKNPAACKDLIIAFASGLTPTAFSVYSVMTKSELVFMIVAYRPSFTDASLLYNILVLPIIFIKISTWRRDKNNLFHCLCAENNFH